MQSRVNVIYQKLKSNEYVDGWGIAFELTPNINDQIFMIREDVKLLIDKVRLYQSWVEGRANNPQVVINFNRGWILRLIVTDESDDEVPDLCLKFVLVRQEPFEFLVRALDSGVAFYDAAYQMLE
jgi:hypothetical protein